MNQSYYFSLGAHICIIQRELSDMGLWFDAVYPESKSSILLLLSTVSH